MMHRSIYRFEFAFLHGKIEKNVIVFLFKILTSDYDHCVDSLLKTLKETCMYFRIIAVQLCELSSDVYANI